MKRAMTRYKVMLKVTDDAPLGIVQYRVRAKDHKRAERCARLRAVRHGYTLRQGALALVLVDGWGK